MGFIINALYYVDIVYDWLADVLAHSLTLARAIVSYKYVYV